MSPAPMSRTVSRTGLNHRDGAVLHNRANQPRAPPGNQHGLRIEKCRVPLGVIGIIYESRPNVTADAFALCFKAGNAVILKGGSDALASNMAIAHVLRQALGRGNSAYRTAS